MTTNFGDVGDFHRKFDLPTSDENPGPRPIDDLFTEFRIKFMHEELEEFEEGWHEGDHAKMFDALMDLVYVAMGTAHAAGYPWEQGWAKVQAANMTKVRAAKDGSDSKRGSSFDVVKPPDFRPPDIASLLASYGWEGKATAACSGCGRAFDDPANTCGPRPMLQTPLGKKTNWCSLRGDWVA